MKDNTPDLPDSPRPITIEEALGIQRARLARLGYEGDAARWWIAAFLAGWHDNERAQEARCVRT